jgi:methyl-accepting chemotaxis protein
MKTLSTRARIFAAIGAMAMVTALVGWTGYRGMAQVNGSMAFMYDNYVVAEGYVAEMLSLQQSAIQAVLTGLVGRSPQATQITHATVDRARIRIAEILKSYEPTVLTAEEKALSATFTESKRQLVALNNQVLELLDAGKYDAAATLYTEQADRLSQATIAAGKTLLDFQVTTANKLRSSADADIVTSSRIIEFSIVFGVALCALCGWLLARSIMGALIQAMTVARRIAGGDLDNEIQIESADEFGQLLEALQMMDKKLSEIVTQVGGSANAVGTAARQLAQGNDDLSSRTQEQAAALEETASSMEQMTATVNQTADNARQANQLAISARRQADEGGAVVTLAVGAMNEINTSSKRIADIIGVIDEIAFQTNLLALNAAVEAARAGEQGRGFAVVASEVRNLAQRSASAAKEIKGLINDSVQKVQNGSSLVEQSGKTLADIIDGVKKLTDVVAEIAAASQEQASGIDQVNNAVTQMDRTTQENAALVEEAASASKAMEQNAEQLVGQIAYFRTKAVLNTHQLALSVEHPMHPHKTTARVAPRVVSRGQSHAQGKPRLVTTHAPARSAKVSGGEGWKEF